MTVAGDPSTTILAVILAVGASAVILFVTGRRDGVALAALLAFALRFGRGLDVQNSGYETDAIQYDQYAIDLVHYWQHGGPEPTFTDGKQGFPTMLAAIYTVIGHAPEVGYVINAFAGALAVIVIAATTRQMGWHRAIKPSAWLVALWPVGFLYGGLLIRESIVTLLLAIGVWGMVRLYRLQVISGLAALVPAGLVMIPMRGGLAFLMLIGLPLTAFACLSVHFKNRASAFLVSIVGALAAFVSLSLLGSRFESSQYFEYNPVVADALNTGTSSFENAGIQGEVLDTGFLGHMLRVPFTAFGPFFWQLTNRGLALAFIDAVLWLMVWGLAIAATLRMTRRSEGLLFLVPPAALIVYLAANSTNFGLIIRLRGTALVLIAPLAAAGWVLLADRVRQRRAGRKDRRRQRVLDRRQGHRGSPSALAGVSPPVP